MIIGIEKKNTLEIWLILFVYHSERAVKMRTFSLIVMLHLLLRSCLTQNFVFLTYY